MNSETQSFMNRTIRRINSVLLFFIPFFLLFSIVFFTQTSIYFQVSDTISKWIVLDLLLTIPFIYFLVIRKTKIPNTTVIPMIFLGLLIGYYALPVEHHSYLDMFKNFGLPLIEVTVLLFLIYKIGLAVRLFSENQVQGIDFYTILQKTSREIIPGRISGFLVSEIAVIYYGILNWKKPILKDNEFSYHKRSGSPALYGALIFIVLVETISVHIILLKYSPLAALILSILSIYSGMQLLGFCRSLSKRPILVNDDTLILRYGILNEATIKIHEIESIELNRKPLKYNNETRRFSMLGDLESHNVVIKCRSAQRMDGIYGITKTFKTLALFVDEKEKFKNAVECAMKKEDVE